MKTANRPFQHIRYEYEQHHIYYLPASLVERLNIPKPIYLVGTRGTGKTTLLKSLEWKERLTNTSLKRQLIGDPFADNFIGTYLKLPLYNLASLESHLPKSYPEASSVILALYLDLIVLQPLCMALAELAALGRLEFSPSNERECLTSIIEQWEFLKSDKPQSDLTLRSFKDALFSAQRHLEKSALYKRPISNEILDQITNIGELGRGIAERFGDLCNKTSGANSWHFKCCLDEAESLGSLGRLTLNTMVRNSSAPLYHVAAFVSISDLSVATAVNGLTLAQEDRELIRLDKISRSEFQKLAEGVATARIQEATSDDSNSISLKKTLGSLDLNGLTREILSESVNPQAKGLLEEASNAGGMDLLTHFLEEELKRQPPAELVHRWQRRRAESAFKRKAMVAAYLGLCKKFGVSVRYAGAQMVIAMSDHCIRDFLRMLNEIYIESNSTPCSFGRTRIPNTSQDIAIKKASEGKADSLSNSGVQEPTPTYAIVDGLGHLTALVQSTGRENAQYRTPERGMFVLQIPTVMDEQKNRILRIVGDAAEAGFLIIKSRSAEEVVFRVHASLAPYYQFSYRGAYYRTTISFDDLSNLSEAKDSSEVTSQVNSLAKRLSSPRIDDTPLFEIESNED